MASCASDFLTWSPDGRVLAFSNSGDDIGILPMDGEREPRLLFSSNYSQFSPSFSPDGRWIAYTSGETGRLRVYVRPYEKPAVAWLVSDEEEAVQPAWSPDGDELFFRRFQSGEMMAVSVRTEPSFESGNQRVLFGGPYAKGSYDVSPDGQRFLMIKQEEERNQTAEIHVVLNWFEELNRLVPTDD